MVAVTDSNRCAAAIDRVTSDVSKGSRVPLRRRGFTAVNLTFEGTT